MGDHDALGWLCSLRLQVHARAKREQCYVACLEVSGSGEWSELTLMRSEHFSKPRRGLELPPTTCWPRSGRSTLGSYEVDLNHFIVD